MTLIMLVQCVSNTGVEQNVKSFTCHFCFNTITRILRNNEYMFRQLSFLALTELFFRTYPIQTVELHFYALFCSIHGQMCCILRTQFPHHDNIPTRKCTNFWSEDCDLLYWILFPKPNSVLGGKAHDDITVMQETVQTTAALFKTGNFQRCFQQWQTCWTLRTRVQGAYSVGSTYRKKFRPFFYLSQVILLRMLFKKL
jgi:hypothetical protein